MKHLAKALTIAFIAGIIGGCQAEEAHIKERYAYTFRLAESHPDEHITTQADYYFADLVEEKSEGRLKVIVYNNKQLGEERDVIEQLQFGAIDFARVSTGPLSEFVPELNVIQLPYLYNSSEHMWRVLESEIGDSFLKSVGDAGFIGLAWMDAGARSFYNSSQPVETLEDLKGMKIRVMQSSMMTDLIDALGAQAIAMPYGEVYSSIQTGSIDGAENNWSSYETAAHYEVAKYYSLDEHVRVPEILVGSSIALAHLSQEDMAIIEESAWEAQQYQRKLWEEKELAAAAKVIKEGVIVNRISDKEAFLNAVKPLYEKYAESQSELIEQIKSME